MCSVRLDTAVAVGALVAVTNPTGGLDLDDLRRALCSCRMSSKKP